MQKVSAHVGIATVASAQVSRAIVDDADHTCELLALIKEKIN